MVQRVQLLGYLALILGLLVLALAEVFAIAEVLLLLLGLEYYRLGVSVDW